ncbi:MAG: AI-2E family transporter YdiK [Planctomycetes bacterium]|nr:AI-2E family transporter YdiK [Planctomycetota bacterium]
MADTHPRRDLTRTVLAILFLGGLLFTSFQVLRPFLVPLIWAALLTVATWPLLARFQTWLGGRRWLAVSAMLVVILATFIVPFSLALSVMVDNAPDAVAWLKSLPERGLPRPPGWLADLPLVGARLHDSWAEFATQDPEALRARFAPHAESLARWFVGQVGGAGLLFVDFLLTVILSGLLYARGEAFARELRAFSRRLAGERGESTALLAGSAIRAVAFGVVVTALIQALVGGLGLALAGIPAAGLLTAIMFVTSVAQVGAAPVLALAAIWLFTQGAIGWGITLGVWTIVVGSLDNVVRPLLIKKGLDLPLALVFSGVIGGLIAFGPVGLFAGPMVLAVAHTLLRAWVAEPEIA